MRGIPALVLAIPALTPAAPNIPTMSGDQFVSIMNQTESRSPVDVIQREKAYELADSIAKLPAVERKKNASILLLDQLRRQFPCRSNGSKS